MATPEPITGAHIRHLMLRAATEHPSVNLVREHDTGHLDICQRYAWQHSTTAYTLIADPESVRAAWQVGPWAADSPTPADGIDDDGWDALADHMAECELHF